MNKILQTLLLLLICSTIGLSQKIYLNKKKKPVKKEKAFYIKTIDKTKDNTFKVVITYAKTETMAEVYYTLEKKSRKKEGEYISYYKNQKIKEKGYYKNGSSIGMWHKYYNNGQPKIDYFITGSKEPPLHTIDNFWDKNGKQLVKNGDGDYTENWYKSETVKETGKVINGMKEGIWKEYYKNGNLHYEEMYENNKIVKGTVYLENGGKANYTKYKEKPLFNGDRKIFHDNIQERINKAKNAFEYCDFGTLVVKFKILKTGELTEITLENCDNKIALNIFIDELKRSQKNWVPATVRGEKVDSKYSYSALLIK